MGSLRNPIGPLPSSIYWRRRVVMLSVVAVLALLTVWIVTAGGGGGKKRADGSNGKNPASTITPGPSQSGPVISQHPGGRNESGGSGDGSGSGAGGGSGSGATSGSGDSGSGDGSGDGSGGGAASGGGSGTGETVPASSSLPNCTAGSVSLTLRSLQNSYSPGQTPGLELAAKNSGSGDCKIDLGPKSAVLTITKAGTDDEYWDSSDCPKGPGDLVYRVPAHSGITYAVKWDRKPSAAHCGTPPAGSAGAGTYLVEAAMAGFAKQQTSFVLAAD